MGIALRGRHTRVAGLPERSRRGRPFEISTPVVVSFVGVENFQPIPQTQPQPLLNRIIGVAICRQSDNRNDLVMVASRSDNRNGTVAVATTPSLRATSHGGECPESSIGQWL